ncbi:hypothetical protein AB2N08_03045 [Massilia aurea]|uniref:hypothetical protein n=1 Tax=Massilia aurea TaxID=373040 RepID=UPI003461DB3F
MITDARELLRVWETGAHASPTRRGVLLMGAALPLLPVEALLGASIGHRDAWLLNLREALFGSHIECLTSCPRCGEQSEIAFQTTDIRATHAAPQHQCHIGEARFRLPDSADLLAIEGVRDAAAAEQALLQRCRLDDADKPGPFGAGIAEAAILAMSRADPQAEVLLALACPACGHRSTALFDIVAHLWCELDHWAGSMLRKVHVLASRYGWSEDSILAMSGARRAAYLDLAGAP